MGGRKLRDEALTLTKKTKVLLIMMAITLCTVLSIIAVSFESVGYNEFALKQNILTKEIEHKVYEEGFYTTGPLYTFIKFPSTWRTIEFSEANDSSDSAIHTRTEDGLDLVVEISFQYRLVKEEILELYEEYGTNYEAYIINIARGVLRDVAGEYDALEFFYNRSTIALAMVDALVSKEMILKVQMGEFQMRKIDLPDNFEKAIEDVEIAKQEIKIAEYQQQAAVIRAKTLIIEAQAQMNITIIEAEATAEALNITLTAEGIALFELASTIGFNTTELLTFLWIRAIEEHDEAYLIIGEDTPLILDL
ncbi:MAG: SPFH domain-containing protein [Promethearchaeota archaeon]